MSDKIEGLDPQYAARLYKMLDRYFNEQELRSLMFGLGVDYDSLAGAGKSDKARELIGYMFRRGSLEKLLLGVNRERPNVPWPYPPINEPFAEPSQSTIPPSRYNTPATMPSRSPQQPMGQPVRTAPVAEAAPTTPNRSSTANPFVIGGILVGFLILFIGAYFIFQMVTKEEDPSISDDTPLTTGITETGFDGEGSDLNAPSENNDNDKTEPAVSDSSNDIPNANEPVGGGTTNLPPAIKLLAFVQDSTTNKEIFTMQTDGSGIRQLTNTDGQNWAPSWSPDGTRIAFTSDRDGNNELYIMDANGSNQQRLTNTTYSEWFPSWSPDGNALVFYSDLHGNRDIFTMNLATNQTVRLTSNPANETYPTWSPDGSKIAFTYEYDENTADIYVVNSDGTNLTQLTNTKGNWFPAWSPDGSLIAFHSDRGGNYQLYTMRPDGSNQIRISFSPANDYDASWSSDGNWIAFNSDRTGSREIYMINVSTGAELRLTNNSVNDKWVEWQP